MIAKEGKMAEVQTKYLRSLNDKFINALGSMAYVMDELREATSLELEYSSIFSQAAKLYTSMEDARAKVLEKLNAPDISD